MTYMGLKFGRIQPQTTELAVLERLKNSIILKWGKGSNHIFAIFHRVLFILAANDDICKSSDDFEIWPDPTTGFYGNR